MRVSTSGRGTACAVVATALLLGACSTEPEAVAEDDGGDAVVVRAVDYGYADLDTELPAGTTVVLDNGSDREVHEILAFRVEDDRPTSELLALPEEELMPLLDMRGVALAPPGEDSTGLPVPPLTLEEPGRYLFLCLIPTDAPPDDVMAAVEEFVASGQQEGAPDYPQTGPPHVQNGMHAEVTVVAE